MYKDDLSVTLRAGGLDAENFLKACGKIKSRRLCLGRIKSDAGKGGEGKCSILPFNRLGNGEDLCFTEACG